MQSFTDHPPRDSGTWLDLTPDQLARIRAAVQEILDDHRRRVEEGEDLFRTLVSDGSVDAGERQAARLAAEEASEICQQAERTLLAIDEGTFGRCIGCGEQIPFERLEALPLTTHCVACPH